MRKGLFAICSVLLISLAVLAPCCAPTTGTINVDATLDGSPWTGTVSYTLTPASGSNISGTSVDDTFTVDPGSWNCTYVSGGPAAAYFVNITPSETQSVSAGGNITFTLNFATFAASPLDAYIVFESWTINGVEVAPGPHTVHSGDIIDIEYTEHVSGATGAFVTVHQTNWLSFHYLGPGEWTTLHVVNADGAVKMSPSSAKKLSQQCTVEGVDKYPCDYIEVIKCHPVKLDVETSWKEVVCTTYTKTINWIGFPSPNDILFDPYQALAGDSFNLTAMACVHLADYEDANPSNDCTDWCSNLTITYMP